MRNGWVTGGLVAATLLTAGAPAMAAVSRPQAVVVVNNTRFEPLALDRVIPAGETARFEIRSDGFGRAAVLIAGATTPGGSGVLSAATLYGPPLVPAGPPRPLHVDPDGNIRDRLVDPVLGPAMVVVIRNDTSSDVTRTLSAYLAQ